MLTCRRNLTKSMRKKGPTMILMVKTTEDSIWNHRGFCITDDFKNIVLSFHDRVSVLSAQKRLIAQMPAEE
ncbi:unnamed protein product [Brassica napus]|uniref:(rape) hypothetical protein n=1 Tax=Brassica napus TaxID=3708 RepID=A0A816I3F1_BRANA|nr:unnamed protein product [Brassica napus]